MCIEEAHQVSLAGISRANVYAVNPRVSAAMFGVKKKRKVARDSDEEEEAEEPSPKQRKILATPRGEAMATEHESDKENEAQALPEAASLNDAMEVDLPVRKRKGPAPLSDAQRAERKDARNQKRRDEYKPQTRINTQADQLLMSCYVQSELTRHLKMLTAVSVARSMASGKLQAVMSVDEAMRSELGFAPARFDLAFRQKVSGLHEMLFDMSSDPLHFDVQHWVERKMLVEDTEQSLRPSKTARLYLRVATIPGDGVSEWIAKRMKRRPSDIPFLAMLALCHGISVDIVRASASAACLFYGLKEASAVIDEAIGAIQLPVGVQQMAAGTRDLTLLYLGVTIAGTPGSRVVDDLKYAEHCRFINCAKSLRWRPYHIPLADTPAPEGAMSFRLRPVISQLEFLGTNCLIGLGTNTTAGGSWFSQYQPTASTSRAVASSHISPPLLSSVDGLDPHRRARLEMLLDSEYQFWGGEEDACVEGTVESIKKNMIDAAWTVNGEVVVVTVAEDITAEERDGRVAGIDAENVGPALREAAHSLKLLHPDVDLKSWPRVRRLRGSFANVFRMTEVVDRPSHLALLSRLLCVLKPVLILGWSNTIHHVFDKLELKSVFTGPAQDVSDFFAGETALVDSVVTLKNQRTILETRGYGYLNSLGKVSISRHGPDKAHINIYIGNLQPGAAKHDPLTANLQREIYHLVHGGVVQPAQTMIAWDLLANGEIMEEEREDRLLHMRMRIQETLDKTDVYARLDQLRSEYAPLKSGARKMRDLHYRAKKAGVAEVEEESSCPEEEPMKVQYKPRAPRRSILAAEDGEARQQQIADLERMADEARAHGRSEDPHHLAPMDMPIGSVAFSSHIMKVPAGRDLTRVAAGMGSTPDAQANVQANQAAIGQLNVKRGIERRTADENGVTPQMQTEWDAREDLLSSSVLDLADVERLSNPEISDALRWAICGHCNELVVVDNKNAKHRCRGDGGVKSLGVTLTNFPLVRPAFTHHLLNDPRLRRTSANGESVPAGLVSRTVTEIFQDPLAVKDVQESLPLDFGTFSLSSDTNVYLAVRLQDELKHWVTLAVDVLLREQSTCSADMEPPKQGKAVNDVWNTVPTTAKPWVESRFSGETCEETLQIFKCNGKGWGLMGEGGPQNYRHRCLVTKAAGRKNGVAGLCSGRTKEIKKLLDLPSCLSTAWWAQHRLPNLRREQR